MLAQHANDMGPTLVLTLVAPGLNLGILSANTSKVIAQALTQ
jgi:hypothetical protein